MVICTKCNGLVPAGEAVRGRCRECHLSGERTRSNRRQRTEVHQKVINTARWRKVRDRARARDDNECQHAGRDYCAGRLEVHHIVKVNADSDLAFDLDNLITLCQHHHSLLERGIVA
jgi:5-methylcytosine-specific restriction endonuclease McrA